MNNVPGSIAEFDERFERNRSAQAGHAQADRGEYLRGCCDSQPKTVAVPYFPSLISPSLISPYFPDAPPQLKAVLLDNARRGVIMNP